MSTIIDKNGKSHKLISHRIDNIELYIALLNMGEIYTNIQDYISEENSKEFLKALKNLENEVGVIKCDEFINSFVIEQGYNFDD